LGIENLGAGQVEWNIGFETIGEKWLGIMVRFVGTSRGTGKQWLTHNAARLADGNLLGSVQKADIVGVHQGVDGDQREAFTARLRNQHTVEGVRMMERKLVHGEGMSQRYWESTEALLQLDIYAFFEWRIELEPADAGFDRDFPYADCADPDIILGIL
jgi:hypothetical protein